MHDPQPQLPFGEQSTLDEIRRLLETQNNLLRTIADRLGDPMSVPLWSAPIEPMADDLFEDDLVGDYSEDDYWDDVWGDDEPDELPHPPHWFARHYPAG